MEIGVKAMADNTIEALNIIDRLEIQEDLYKLAKSWGSTDAQADDFSKLHADKFGRDKGATIHVTSNLPANHKDVQEEFAKSHPHLLPPIFAVSDADKAFINGDLTAKGRLVKEIGIPAATELARRYGLDDVHDRKRGIRPDNIADREAAEKAKNKTPHASNPFHKSNWNVSKQGSLLRAVGPEKCAAIARSVGVTIGATKPNMNF
jgi:hypothetical protein